MCPSSVLSLVITDNHSLCPTPLISPCPLYKVYCVIGGELPILWLLAMVCSTFATTGQDQLLATVEHRIRSNMRFLVKQNSVVKLRPTAQL
jgi:hypothetical protein